MAKQEAGESSDHIGELKLSDGRRVSLRLMQAADKQGIEAPLEDWVVDRKGRPRDLLIMSRDLEGLSDQVTA